MSSIFAISRRIGSFSGVVAQRRELWGCEVAGGAKTRSHVIHHILLAKSI